MLSRASKRRVPPRPPVSVRATLEGRPETRRELLALALVGAREVARDFAQAWRSSRS